MGNVTIVDQKAPVKDAAVISYIVNNQKTPVVLTIDGVKSVINPGVKYPFTVSDTTKEATITTASGKTQNVNANHNDPLSLIVWILQDQDLVNAKIGVPPYDPINDPRCVPFYSVTNSSLQDITIMSEEDNNTIILPPATTLALTTKSCAITIKLNNGMSYKIGNAEDAPVTVDNEGIWYITPSVTIGTLKSSLPGKSSGSRTTKRDSKQSTSWWVWLLIIILIVILILVLSGKHQSVLQYTNL